jgi:hypothetical protein
MTKFVKGVVTNPTGRPKGSGSRQKLFREFVLPKLPDLVNKAIQMAQNGDQSMMKFLLERGLPIKAVSEPLDIHGASVEETTKNLLEYVNSGDLTPDEASKLAAIVQKDAEIKNQQILIEKITALECKLDSVGKTDINLNTEVKGNGQEMDSGRN